MSNAMYSARDTVIVAPPGAAYEMPASSNNMDQQGKCQECRRVGRFVSLTREGASLAECRRVGRFVSLT